MNITVNLIINRIPHLSLENKNLIRTYDAYVQLCIQFEFRNLITCMYYRSFCPVEIIIFISCKTVESGTEYFYARFVIPFTGFSHWLQRCWNTTIAMFSFFSSFTCFLHFPTSIYIALFPSSKSYFSPLPSSHFFLVFLLLFFTQTHKYTHIYT